MATVTQTPRQPAEIPTARLHRIGIATYEKMAACGALTPRDRVVLLDGLLVDKMTKGDAHITATRLTVAALQAIVPAGWHVAKEDPIALPGGPGGVDSMPEPDVAILRGGIRDYSRRKPTPADVALIVEVADSTLGEDRRGLARYAWAGITAVWLVNLPEGVVEEYTEPTGPAEVAGYRSSRVYRAGERIAVVLEGRAVGELAVSDMLP